MDELLIEQVARGDKKAFLDLVLKYKNSVYNIAFFYTGNKEDAEDITSEVFFKVWKNAGSFKGKSKFYTWLYKITVNHCYNFKRNKKKQNELSSIDDYAKVIPDSSYSKPDEKYEEKVKNKLLCEMLNELPERQKMAIILTKIEGNSYEETAQVLDTSKSSVESLIYRGMKKLKKIAKKRGRI